LGERLGQQLDGGAVVSIEGDLGAGKTVFCKGIACALGVSEMLTSPTFVLKNSYIGRDYTLHHIDAYRLEGVDARETGIYEYIGDQDTITVVEWACYIVVGVDIVVQIEYLPIESARKITIKRVDKKL
jgi:tRNA threonylcarbamoyladenosine biosynthesis protein TsaE